MSNYVLDIPDDEIKQFQSYLNIYSTGKKIVSEGDRFDKRIFLLRQGKVNVLRQVRDRQQVLGTIEAVNFFGEMSAVSSQPRTATIIAATDPVVVYAFEKKNLPAILSNYKWSSMLITRMTDNLSKMNDDFEKAQVTIDKLQNSIGEMMGVFNSLYKAVKKDHQVAGLVVDAIPELITAFLRETGVDGVPADSYRLDQLRRRGLISDRLYFLAQSSVD